MILEAFHRLDESDLLTIEHLTAKSAEAWRVDRPAIADWLDQVHGLAVSERRGYREGARPLITDTAGLRRATQALTDAELSGMLQHLAGQLTAMTPGIGGLWRVLGAGLATEAVVRDLA